MLVKLIYASTASAAVTPQTINDILKVAQQRNALCDMTGMLVFDQHDFLQAIEGERQTVDDLLTKLTTDSRHSRVTLLSYASIELRSYAEWSMEFKSAAAVSKALFLRHGGSSRFEPYGLSEAGALQLMEAFRVGVPAA
jgi:RecA-family ATPase